MSEERIHFGRRGKQAESFFGTPSSSSRAPQYLTILSILSILTFLTILATTHFGRHTPTASLVTLVAIILPQNSGEEIRMDARGHNVRSAGTSMVP